MGLPSGKTEDYKSSEDICLEDPELHSTALYEIEQIKRSAIFKWWENRLYLFMRGAACIYWNGRNYWWSSF